jgi:predicted AAA+ superfamily ATPase
MGSWGSSYVDALLSRDLDDLAEIRRKGIFLKLLSALAGWSSQYLSVVELAAALETSRITVRNYITYLSMLFITHEVPPWSKTDHDQIRKRDKFYMADTGLMTALLQWNEKQILEDEKRLGKLVETFVFNEIFAQTMVDGINHSLFQWRDSNRREIDFLHLRRNGQLLGFEVKSGSSVAPEDFRHLRWFAAGPGKKQPFRGFVLYNGTQVHRLGENFAAIPIQALWAE